MKLEFTDLGALLVRVNRHKNNFDGSICVKPLRHDCGAPDYFKKENCSKGRQICGDRNLFNSANYNLIKIITDGHNPFEQQMELLNQGKSPVIFFFAKGKTNYQFYLVGAYTVKKIDLVNFVYKKEVKITPDHIVRLPMDVMGNDLLWNGSFGDLGWCRNVYRQMVAQTLEMMLGTIRNINSEEYVGTSRELEYILEQLTGEVSDLNEVAASQPLDVVQQTAEHVPLGYSAETTEVESLNIYVSQGSLADPERMIAFDSLVDTVLTISAQHGYYYDRHLVAMLHNSILVNPFLILSGISGGGKTSFAQFYASGLGAELEVVSVRPDWTSPNHFLGVYNPFEEDFVPSAATEFIRKANLEYLAATNEKRDSQFFVLILDEMNLARAEHYFSDFLSKMQLIDESKRTIRLYDERKGNYDRELCISPNLKIIGTVNIDETTFLFSPKVLDRASYFSLNEINIEGMGKVLINRSGELNYPEIIQKAVIPELRDLNSKLSEFGQSFGYRTAWEIIKWVDSALSVGIITSEYAGLDIQIENKVLVKLSDHRSGSVFKALETYFKDRTYPDDDIKLIFEKTLRRLETLITRAEREEFAIGQQ